ncbi:phenylacetic acid degradation protein PaaN [Cesiribacter sp. SM1]|uniref:phenylacetic acid degradation protein PaaN n=1 Tax=Cesiribacter sp. SM1 TaxID=2861196 RepID=UPI001CD67B1C|nr:phenylacetic acid degradation protein PaaN [Cesiribacter sp. SM1]
MSLFEKHRSVLTNAVDALHKRDFFALYPENPSPKVYGETADADGQQRFKSHLGKKFEELLQEPGDRWVGEEESPYTLESLGISYPAASTETLISRSLNAFDQWRKITADTRAAVLIESLERLKDRFFEIAYATMHTSGQGFMMAFQASGPHAADRALEAIATGYEELQRVPRAVTWDKPMGKFNITLDKQWRAVPKGIGLVVGCSTFPTWNSVPGLYASLITGNTAIVKPHPTAILPMAIFVAELQKVLAEEGLDPHIVQLAPDTLGQQITKELAEHPDVVLIDYTGGSDFGNYLENLKGKAVFTEKTGVNSVILDSMENPDEVAQNLAFSVLLYSGQMCTAPQNFFVPEAGIKTPGGTLSFAEFAEKFTGAIESLVNNPKAAPHVLGAIQNQRTSDRLSETAKLPGRVLLQSKSVENPVFPKARTASPVVLEVAAENREVYSKELFGPVVLLIKTKSTVQSIQLARDLAKQHGAISCGAYVTDDELKETIADQMGLAATPVSFNLTGGIYLNQNAGFSDFHVTGGNPAGNASFTNPEYVVKRFTWVGFREPAKAAAV